MRRKALGARLRRAHLYRKNATSSGRWRRGLRRHIYGCLIWSAAANFLCGSLALARSDAPWVGHFTARHVVTAASPDSTFALLASAIDSARQSIHMSVYELDNIFVAEAIDKALGRGVDVTVLLEGAPIPKLPPAELYIAHRLAAKGAKFFFYDKAQERNGRTFKYFHAKYTVVDGKRVVVGSANYGLKGHPADNSFGNREWEVGLDDRQAATLFDEAFEHDRNLTGEWVKYGSSPRYRADSSFEPVTTPRHGHYEAHFAPMDAYDVPVLTVFAPENALDERALLGALGTAEERVDVEQLNFETYWGAKPYNREPEDSPMMAIILKLARAGRAIRILLNNDFVFREPNPLTGLYETLATLPFTEVENDDDEPDEPRAPKRKRDNRATLEYLSKVAHREGLNLGVRLLNYKRCGLNVLHNKGMIVDNQITLVSSLNWGESAMKFNREAGVLMKSPSISRYYTAAFDYDWRCSAPRDEE